MKECLILAIAAGVGLTACSQLEPPGPTTPTPPSAIADIVYTNGKIYTVDDAQPWAEAVAIKDRKFLVVGSAREAEAATGDGTKVVDLGGKFVMPGIVDMHAHPFTGVDLGTGVLNLNTPSDQGAIVADIRAYVEANPENDVIMGGSWNVGGVFDGDSPDKRILDEIAPDVPVFLLSQSGHSAWVNSKALELAGIDEDFENTGAYIFDRYPGSNEPSGTVRESGMVLVMSKMHYLEPPVFSEYLEDEIERYSRYGVTAIQTAEGSRSHLLGAALLEKQGRLAVRLFPALDWITSQLRVLDDDETRAFLDDWERYETELIKPHYVKIFADGAADSHTLLLKEPYSDDPGNYGSMYLSVDDYREAILHYFSRGVTVHVHAIGDGTAEKIVGIFEEAEKAYPESKASLHLAHLHLTDEAELDRLARLKKVTVDFSPMLAVPAPPMKMFMTDPLGEERHRTSFLVKSAIDKGLVVGFGSDFPSSLVPEPDAFWYMEGWVTRAVPGEPQYGALGESQGVSVAEAIRGFTLGGAQALGYDYSDMFGSIEVGKSADMAILNQNPLEIAPTEIHKTLVEQTVFRGQVVFDRAAEVAERDLVRYEVHPELREAVNDAELNLLVQEDLWGGGGTGVYRNREIAPGAKNAPAGVNQAFAELLEQGYAFARPAETVYYEAEDRD